MKFMLLMNGSQEGFRAFSSLPPEDIRANMQFMSALYKSLTESGELVETHGLALPEQARFVTAGSGGPPAITDGPFPETKEFLAGFWIVDVETPERANAIAARISACPGRNGAPYNMPIEVRQVMDHSQTEV